MEKTVDARKFQHWEEDEDDPNYTQYFETARIDNAGGKFIGPKDSPENSDVFPGVVLPINPRPARGNSNLEPPLMSKQHRTREPASRKSVDRKERSVNRASNDPRRSPDAIRGPAPSVNLRTARSKPDQEVQKAEQQQPSRRSSDFIWRDVAARKLVDQQERDFKATGDYNHSAYRYHNSHRHQEDPGYKGGNSSPTGERRLSSDGGVAISPHKSRKKHEPLTRETVGGVGWDESGPSSSNSYNRVPRTERIAAANVPAILANRPQAIGLKLARRDTSPNAPAIRPSSRSQANGHNKPVECDTSPEEVPGVTDIRPRAKSQKAGKRDTRPNAPVEAIPTSRPQAIDHRLAKRGSYLDVQAKPNIRPQANGQKLAKRDTSPKCNSCFCFSEAG